MLSQVCTKILLKLQHTPSTNWKDLPHSLPTSALNLPNDDLQQLGVIYKCNFSN